MDVKGAAGEDSEQDEEGVTENGEKGNPCPIMAESRAACVLYLHTQSRICYELIYLRRFPSKALKNRQCN